MRMSVKLPLGMVLLALFAVTANSIAGLYIAAETSRSEIESKLVAVASGKANELAQFLVGIDKDITTLARAERTKTGLDNFAYEFDIEGEKAQKTYQKRYIEDNLNKSTERHLLANPDVDVYDNLHAEYHAYFRVLAEEYGYDDVLLVDTLGNVVYSVYKHSDFAVNLNKDEWAETALGQAYQLAMKKAVSDPATFIDVAPYDVIEGDPTAFISMPVFRNDAPIGAVVLRLPYDRIQSMLSRRDGLGVTGEVILINSQGSLLSDSIHTEKDDRLNVSIQSPLLAEARNGDVVLGQISGYRGIEAASVLKAVSFHNDIWVLAALIDENEVFAPLATMRNWMIGIAVAVLGIAAAAGLWFSRSIVGPIRHVIGDVKRLSGGDPDFVIAKVDRKDEVGDIARAVKSFQDGMLERRVQHIERDKEIERRQERALMVTDLIETFKVESQDVLAGMLVNSERMQENARSMTEAADDSANHVKDSETESSQASENVQNVVSASEQLSLSIEEISRRVEESGRIIQSATDDTSSANVEIESLDVAATKIGEVVTLISDIAEQTNLLALNATIEAARAGEMGKGFAVVATEVKSLANQTAKATEEISSHISNIQVSTGGAVERMRKISATMAEVQTYTNEIATSIQEQGAATTEISQNIAMTARSTQSVAQTISGVDEQVEKTKKSADVVLDAACDVSQQSNELRKSIDGFLQNVSAA